jgi:hypothetical protein
LKKFNDLIGTRMNSSKLLFWIVSIVHIHKTFKLRIFLYFLHLNKIEKKMC